MVDVQSIAVGAKKDYSHVIGHNWGVANSVLMHILAVVFIECPLFKIVLSYSLLIVAAY